VAKSTARRSTLERRVRAIPWGTLAQGVVIVGARWVALSAKERARLVELARASRGRVSNLSARERRELRKLVHRLDVRGMSRDLTVLARSRRARRRRGGRWRRGRC
jgi:FixJ family two-component response regulator